MESIEALKRSLHHSELQPNDALVIILGSDNNKPKKVADVKRVAISAGYRKIKSWNISDRLSRLRSLALLGADGWELTVEGQKRLAELKKVFGTALLPNCVDEDSSKIAVTNSMYSMHSLSNCSGETVQKTSALKKINGNTPDGKPIIIYTEHVTMGDSYKANQAGAMGPQAHSHDNTFQQVRFEGNNTSDLAELADQLGILRKAMKADSTSVEHDEAIGQIAAAETAAKKGEGAKIPGFLKSAGKWALDTATKIGVAAAVEAIKGSIHKQT